MVSPVEWGRGGRFNVADREERRLRRPGTGLGLYGGPGDGAGALELRVDLFARLVSWTAEQKNIETLFW